MEKSFDLECHSHCFKEILVLYVYRQCETCRGSQMLIPCSHGKCNLSMGLYSERNTDPCSVVAYVLPKRLIMEAISTTTTGHVEYPKHHLCYEKSLCLSDTPNRIH